MSSGPGLGDLVASGSQFDEQQRVVSLGHRLTDTNEWTVRFLAARACLFARVHVQHDGTGGRDYNVSTSVSSTQYDMRQNRQRDVVVSVNGVNDYYVFVIPEFLEGDGTYTKYDGDDGEDHMAFYYLPA